MSKDLSMAMLYDFYGELLTEKQAQAMNLYYNEDLSLSEIAEPLGISRQGVRDFIKRGETTLLELEEKLGLVKRFLTIGEKIDDTCKLIDSIILYENKYINSYKLSGSLKELKEEVKNIAQEL